jgi:hypothetical protein
VQEAAPPGQQPLLNQLARAPGKLPPPPGRRKPDNRGKELGRLKWGAGEENATWPNRIPAAVRRIDTLTRAELDALLITVEEANLWAYAYEVEARESNHGNLSAGPRAALMRCIAKMLADANSAATGMDCCSEERAWRHPANVQRRR